MALLPVKARPRRITWHRWPTASRGQHP